MVLAFLVFLLVVGVVLGVYAGVTQLPGMLAARKLDQRLREVSTEPKDFGSNDDSIVKR